MTFTTGSSEGDRRIGLEIPCELIILWGGGVKRTQFTDKHNDNVKHDYIYTGQPNVEHKLHNNIH